MKNYKEVYETVLHRIKPSSEEIGAINFDVKKILNEIEKQIKAEKIEAKVFLGGSFAKKTAIKKGKHDVDVFIRYGKKHSHDDLTYLTSKILKNFKDISRVHGSRDYFVIEPEGNFFVEVIPVKEIKKPSEAENITDLSYFHVKYANRKIKAEQMLDEIMVAKGFCYGVKCYGAESYIKGFSGYGLELLIYHYKTFFNFAKAMANAKGKTIIDIEKAYKNKNQILLDLNSSKLSSPVILIDPTYKQRNVLAALSEKTFEKFQKECRKFIKNPGISFFEEKKQNMEKIEEKAKKDGEDFVCLKLITSRQAGDIAGSKLLKFFNHLKCEMGNSFEIKKSDFFYEGGKQATAFISAKPKKEELQKGPLAKDKKNAEKFKKANKKTFVKEGRLYSKKICEKDLKKFISVWAKKNREKIKDMSVDEVKVS